MAETPFRLDEYDRRLLYELDLDSGLSVSALARRLRRSKQFVLFRLNRLETEGVNTHYTAIIDMAKLGYSSYRIYLKFHQMPKKDYDGVIEFLKHQPHVWTLTRVHGRWDLAVFLGTREMAEVHECWDGLMGRYKNHIRAYNFSLYGPIHNFNRTFFLGKNADAEVKVRTCGIGPKEEVDALDWRIIQTFAPNVRQSNLELARKLHVAPKTVHKRIAELERRKIIRGYKIEPNLAKLGYAVYRIDIELCSTRRKKEMFEYCRAHPAIFQVQDSVGHADFEIEAVAKSQNELVALMDEMQTRFKDVVDDVTYFAYSTHHLLNYIPD